MGMLVHQRVYQFCPWSGAWPWVNPTLLVIFPKLPRNPSWNPYDDEVTNMNPIISLSDPIQSQKKYMHIPWKMSMKSWLVVFCHPSEIWWSSSVGIKLFPIYGKKCSKPPTRIPYTSHGMATWISGPKSHDDSGPNLSEMVQKKAVLCREHQRGTGRAVSRRVAFRKVCSTDDAINISEKHGIP